MMLAGRYYVPWRKVGRCFMRSLSNRLRGVKVYRWNVENFIVFQMVILQWVRYANEAQAIRRRIGKCLYAWEASHH